MRMINDKIEKWSWLWWEDCRSIQNDQKCYVKEFVEFCKFMSKLSDVLNTILWIGKIQFRVGINMFHKTQCLSQDCELFFIKNHISRKEKKMIRNSNWKNVEAMRSYFKAQKRNISFCTMNFEWVTKSDQVFWSSCALRIQTDDNVVVLFEKTLKIKSSMHCLTASWMKSTSSFLRRFKSICS
jgi:hypothetical protein